MSFIQGGISNILEELVVQPLLVSISALTLATETVRSILKIDDLVSDICLVHRRRFLKICRPLYSVINCLFLCLFYRSIPDKVCMNVITEGRPDSTPLRKPDLSLSLAVTLSNLIKHVFDTITSAFCCLICIDTV